MGRETSNTTQLQLVYLLTVCVCERVGDQIWGVSDFRVLVQVNREVLLQMRFIAHGNYGSNWGGCLFGKICHNDLKGEGSFGIS